MQTEHPWDSLLTDRDHRVIENGGYGRPRGLGTRPVLMIIDCQYNYIGDDRPVDVQQSKWPAGGGEAAWAAVRHIGSLADEARSVGVPVLYTRNVQKRTLRFDSFAAKSARDHSTSLDGSMGSQIVAELAPLTGDLVLEKSYASAFHGTPLPTWLVGLGADTLILTGVSTSGCVRATAVDAVSLGYRCAVVQDAVADRITASHLVGLLDLWMKYTDLATSDETAEYLRQQHAGVAV